MYEAYAVKVFFFVFLLRGCNEVSSRVVILQASEVLLPVCACVVSEPRMQCNQQVPDSAHLASCCCKFAEAKCMYDEKGGGGLS